MIMDKLTNWFFLKLKSSSRIHSFIWSICDEYYTKESLKKPRIWGDPSRLKIGNGVHLNNATINTASGCIFIDDDAFLGHQVSLLTGTHDVKLYGEARKTAVPVDGRDIFIGKGAWIASNAIILGPCNIGDNAVIGAGSIATGIISSNTVYVGIPAKAIRKLQE